MNKKKISLLASILVTLLLLWILYSQIEFSDLIYTFTRIFFPALLIFMGIHLLGSFLRAWRYKILLIPQKISWGDILITTFIRNLFVDLLPARIGSLSYIYVLNKRLKFTFESAASSFTFAFILDFLTLGPFIILALLMAAPGINLQAGTPLAILSIVFLVVILMLYIKVVIIFRFFLKTFQYFLRVFHLSDKKWAHIVIEKIKLTIVSILETQKRGVFVKVLILSFLIRLSKYCALFFLLFALLRSHGFAIQEINFFIMILGITGAELTSVLPVKGIGGFGTWESAWALTLTQLGFESRIAILSSGVHLITNVFEYFLGIISILILASPRSRKKHI
ncbi:MAG: flippase-like domain-containing protein [Candidatus Aminicenantes bacterium]|nr:flippase-like domain-containing protein [Candidatus Aminicenantes bacterium]